MKLKYLTILSITSVLSLSMVAGCANPCASKTDPCAGKSEEVKGDPCAGKTDPCAGKSEEMKAEPCAGN